MAGLPLKHCQAVGNGDHILVGTRRANVLDTPHFPRDVVHRKHLSALPSSGFFCNKGCFPVVGYSAGVSSQQQGASTSRHCVNLQELFIQIVYLNIYSKIYPGKGK